MEDKISNSKILERIKKWIMDNTVDNNTEAALLVGSWAEDRAKEKSDVDIVLIKNDQPEPIQNIKTNVEGKNLDIWIHSQEYILENLQKDNSSLSDIYQKSLIITFFNNCKIWFEKEDYIKKCKSICENWQWDPKDRIYIKMMGKPPKMDWAKEAYEENLRLLHLFEQKFDNNLPISHYLKDYPELYKPVEKSKVMSLYKLVIPLFEQLNIEKEWIEITDTKKAILEEDWDIAFVSLKDVLYFLLRRYVSPPSMERRDPSFWSFVESKIIPQEYIKALEIAYCKIDA